MTTPTQPVDPRTGPGREVIAELRAGRLAGAERNGIASFTGIPYAAPPVGPRRWRPPEPAPAWSGIRPARSFGPAPLQPQPLTSSIMFQTNFADRSALVMSEDCLYLNVWTPDVSAPAGLPVMVVLHGGGNRMGHGGQEIYDGTRMAGRGLVVVTINMRLGALGFLALPELAAENEDGATGNYALLDIVAALRWVQENIGRFGGDPARVTLAGNSAGAAHVTHLMAAPAARGLFRAAIGQSAAGIFRAEGRMPDRAQAQSLGRAALDRAGLGAAPLARLRQLPATAFLLDAHLGVVADGRLLTRDSEDVFAAGQQAPVPLLAGSNRDEGSVYTLPGAAADLRELVGRHPEGAALASAYPVDDARIRCSARAFTGETRFGYPVWRWARTHARTSGAPVWLYRFEHEPPLPPVPDLAPPPDGQAGHGAYHTAELPYTADNLWTRAWDWREQDQRLATAMADAWARFVRDLDPNGGTLPHWERLGGASPGRVLAFGDQVYPDDVSRAGALELLDRLPRPLSPAGPERSS